MGQQIVQGSQELAQLIKLRRIELSLTIEEAASRARVGTKSWSRYESGESIRKDKVKGVCKALNWSNIPEEFAPNNAIDLAEYQAHEAWSQYLCDSFGTTAAISFAIGSDILLDHINEDMQDLSRMPSSTHLGQIGTSFIMDSLPPQFFMHYNYEFLFELRAKVLQLREKARLNQQIIAHSVLEELILYLIVDQSSFLIEENDALHVDGWDEWIFDLFDDMDIVTFLYSDNYINDEHPFHFNQWAKHQFYCDENEA